MAKNMLPIADPQLTSPFVSLKAHGKNFSPFFVFFFCFDEDLV